MEKIHKEEQQRGKVMDYIELLVLFFVSWNTLLQTRWYFRDKNIDKHHTNNDKK